MSDQVDNWYEFYKDKKMAFPPEGLIRLIKGGPYPNLTMPKPQPGQSILDIGFGDGSSFPLYKQCGLEAYGIEISHEIASKAIKDLDDIGLYPHILTGNCSSIPCVENDFFDYVVSWNSCYYMSVGTGMFTDHVDEMARVLKPGGWLICSVPTRNCFIFDDSHQDGNDYRIIDSEFFGLRSGERMRCFHSKREIESEFKTHFEDFSHSTIDIDQFGLRYAWHVFTAKKRNR